MPNAISSKMLEQIVQNEINDQALKERLTRLGAPYLDTVIREAGVILEDRLRSATGLNDLHGVDLIDGAFAPDKGKLVFSQHRAEQEGVRLLYRGAIQFIRNPPMHKLMDIPIEKAKILLRLIDSLLLLLPNPDPSEDDKDFLGLIRQYQTPVYEAMSNVLSKMESVVKETDRLYLGYQSATANLYWQDSDGHRCRFFALQAKQGSAQVWTDYLRKSGHEELANKIEGAASSLLPHIRGQKSGSIKVLNSNTKSIGDLIDNLARVFVE